MSNTRPPKPAEGTLFIAMEAEGSCDWCGAEVKGNLTRFVGYGDACDLCIASKFSAPVCDMDDSIDEDDRQRDREARAYEDHLMDAAQNGY